LNQGEFLLDDERRRADSPEEEWDFFTGD